ncbi:MAG: L,D-transpeptidase [Alphaproteobacteria bacterium]|nr:L,D-transpeptidase [Alphaproteobacteria bacterium]
MLAQAQAAQIKFSPDTFSVLGAMNGSQVASATLPSAQDLQYQRQSTVGPTRTIIDFTSQLAPGSILVRTAERKLYFILPGQRAIMYRVGVGREGFAWSGENRVSRKAVWPTWTPPKVMIEREAARGHIIPAFMPGGTENPLGARALYIGNTDFRVHGTTQPWSIGQAVSSGCIRMLNENVIELYDRVKVGAKIVVE